LKIAIPPFNEQQRVADVLDTVDQTIERTRTVIEKAKRLKKALAQDLFTKGIEHTSFQKTQLGIILQHGKSCRLGMCLMRRSMDCPCRWKRRGNILFYVWQPSRMVIFSE